MFILYYLGVLVVATTAATALSSTNASLRSSQLELGCASSQSLMAFTSSCHRPKNKYNQQRRINGHYSSRGTILVASMAASNDDGTIIKQGETSQSDNINDISTEDTATALMPSNSPNTNTGSTAIILNMNARSVTPQLISIASSVVGSENVFVTKTAVEAKLAARTVVRGCISDVNGDGCRLDKYSLVIPVGGDGTLSGWINTMVDEILLFHRLENNNNGNNDAAEETSQMSVEDALRYLPTMGYIPMGTGNGLGYVIGCGWGKLDDDKNDNDGKDKKSSSLLSKINILSYVKRQKLERTRLVMKKLKDVGDSIQKVEETQGDTGDIAEALSSKCSVVKMPLMEVTHPEEDDTAKEEMMKGDLCFFAGAGFDSLMLHDFQAIKAWAKSSAYGPRALPSFVKEALSSVAGYCVALVTKTLPQTLRYGTHKIHVKVTTKDTNTLWVDHRRGDFSELAIMQQPKRQEVNGARKSKDSTEAATLPTQQKERHLIYKGTTGIIAAATTPYYGGGMKLFPYARLIPQKMQLRLGRISPLTGFFNIPKIFEGSYREKGERSFGCLDFIGDEFEVTVRSARYDEYVRMKAMKKKSDGGKRRRWFKWLRRNRGYVDDDENTTANTNNNEIKPKGRARGFPFQHSGESMGCKERFAIRVVQHPVSFVSFLTPRVIVDD